MRFSSFLFLNFIYRGWFIFRILIAFLMCVGLGVSFDLFFLFFILVVRAAVFIFRRQVQKLHPEVEIDSWRHFLKFNCS